MTGQKLSNHLKEKNDREESIVISLRPFHTEASSAAKSILTASIYDALWLLGVADSLECSLATYKLQALG